MGEVDFSANVKLKTRVEQTSHAGHLVIHALVIVAGQTKEGQYCLDCKVFWQPKEG